MGPGLDGSVISSAGPLPNPGLYIHVPFCRSKCHSCAFASRPWNEQAMAAYLAALEREIDLWRRRLGPAAFSSLYFGGGTPSLLPLPGLERILNSLRRHFSFDSGLEATFEANPESLSLSYLKKLRSLGLNRLSLGIQSYDDQQLAMLGRPHTGEQAVRACDLARAAGFYSISLDLIWGLPGQTLRQWLDFLERAVTFAPKHLSCYGLTLEPGTLLARRVKEGSLCLPSEDDLARMFIQCGEFLESYGYLQYEISNYARIGYQSRHNSACWAQADYLGLGPAATSTLNARRWTNPADLAAYAEQVEMERIGQDAEIIDRPTSLREMVMLALRTSQGLNLNRYRRLSGQSFCQRFQAEIRELHARGLVRVSQGHFRLSRTGMLVSDAIIRWFMA